MLPEGIMARVDTDSYDVPAIFKLLQKAGGIDDKMMYNTYNMGLGMILAVDASEVEKTMNAIRRAGETPYVIGSCESCAGTEKGVILYSGSSVG